MKEALKCAMLVSKAGNAFFQVSPRPRPRHTAMCCGIVRPCCRDLLCMRWALAGRPAADLSCAALCCRWSSPAASTRGPCLRSDSHTACNEAILL